MKPLFITILFLALSWSQASVASDSESVLKMLDKMQAEIVGAKVRKGLDTEIQSMNQSQLDAFSFYLASCGSYHLSPFKKDTALDAYECTRQIMLYNLRHSYNTPTVNKVMDNLLKISALYSSLSTTTKRRIFKSVSKIYNHMVSNVRIKYEIEHTIRTRK